MIGHEKNLEVKQVSLHAWICQTSPTVGFLYHLGEPVMVLFGCGAICLVNSLNSKKNKNVLLLCVKVRQERLL